MLLPSIKAMNWHKTFGALVLTLAAWPVVTAAPIASGTMAFRSGAQWSACHAGIQTPERSITGRSTSIAAAPGDVHSDPRTDTQARYLTLQSGAQAGPVSASGSIIANYEMPLGLPCLDIDINLDLTSSTSVTGMQPFDYGRNTTDIILHSERNPADPRPVVFEPGQLRFSGIRLSANRGQADADFHATVTEFRPGAAGRVLFDLALSTPSVQGARLLASSSVDGTLARMIADSFVYNAAEDSYESLHFGFPIDIPMAPLVDEYRNLLFHIETSLSVPEPSTWWLVLAAALVPRRRFRGQRVRIQQLAS